MLIFDLNLHQMGYLFVGGLVCLFYGIHFLVRKLWLCWEIWKWTFAKFLSNSQSKSNGHLPAF